MKKYFSLPLFSTNFVVDTHLRPNIVWIDFINVSLRVLSKPVKKRIFVDEVVRPRRRGGGAIGRSVEEGLIHWIFSIGDASFRLVGVVIRSIEVLPFLFLLNRKYSFRKNILNYTLYVDQHHFLIKI